jgi:hypothetical protein
MHFMNPQRAAHMGASSPAQIRPVAQADGAGLGMDDPNAGIGSAQSGYATPDNGPFECANCIHFDGQGACDNPQVQSDPEVNGQVDAEGCCNLFKPAGEEQDEGEGESAPGPGAGETEET